MEGIIVEMEESSSRIEDPIYPKCKKNKFDAFFGVFFCYLEGDKS